MPPCIAEIAKSRKLRWTAQTAQRGEKIYAYRIMVRKSLRK
jgi:hypothetical protein